jgi:TPR repeat protein
LKVAPNKEVHEMKALFSDVCNVACRPEAETEYVVASLKDRAVAGDVVASHKLGLHYFRVHAVPDAVDQFRKGALAKYPPAMYSYSELLFDDPDGSRASEAASILEALVEIGFPAAELSLGHRMLVGDGVHENVSRGMSLLARAAERRCRGAMCIIAIRELAECESARSSISSRWLTRLGVVDMNAVAQLSFLMYAQALKSITANSRLRFLNEAETILLATEGRRDEASTCLLALMLRRNEVSCGGQLPTLRELLADLINNNHAFALVNLALATALGFQCAADWRKADDLMSKLTLSTFISEWWNARACEGDPEGDIVLALLRRHGFAMKSQKTNTMIQSSTCYPSVPQWIFDIRTAVLK